MADRKVSIKVVGVGILQGFGSADPKTEENYFDTVHTTFDGKALAVIRPTASQRYISRILRYLTN